MLRFKTSLRENPGTTQQGPLFKRKCRWGSVSFVPFPLWLCVPLLPLLLLFPPFPFGAKKAKYVKRPMQPVPGKGNWESNNIIKRALEEFT